MVSLLISLAVFVFVIFVLRAVGAWMLRIDEVIKNQKEIIDGLGLTLDELRRINQNAVSKARE